MQTVPIRPCTVLAGDGSAEVYSVLSCPGGSSVLAATCRECRYLEPGGAVHGQVRCSPPIVEARRDPREDLGEKAIRTRVRDLLEGPLVCAREDASVEMATALLVEHGLACLPIVDDERKLVGIVTRADLLREHHLEADTTTSTPTDLPGREDRDTWEGFQPIELASRLVSDVMTPRVHALPESAPLSYAVALMATNAIHQVPVVGDDGCVVGVLTAVRALQWTAEALGYRLADAPARPSAETGR
jgi:CBS domain-containing protein